AIRSTAVPAIRAGEAGDTRCFHRSRGLVQPGPSAGCSRSVPGAVEPEPPGSGSLCEARAGGSQKLILEESSCAPYTVQHILYVKQCMASSTKCENALNAVRLSRLDI